MFRAAWRRACGRNTGFFRPAGTAILVSLSCRGHSREGNPGNRGPSFHLRRKQRIHLGHQTGKLQFVPPCFAEQKTRLAQTNRFHAGPSGLFCAHLPIHHAGRARRREWLSSLDGRMLRREYLLEIVRFVELFCADSVEVTGELDWRCPPRVIGELMTKIVDEI